MGAAGGRIGRVSAVTAALALGALPLCLGLTVGLWANTASGASGPVGGPPGYLALTGTMVTMQLLFSTALFYLAYREGESAGEGRRDGRSRGVHLALVGLVTVVWMGWAMGMLADWPVQTDGWAAATAAALVILSGGVVAYAGHARMARADAAAGPRGAWRHAAGVAFWWMLFPTLLLPVAAVWLVLCAVWAPGAFLWPLPATAVFLLGAALISRIGEVAQALGERKGAPTTGAGRRGRRGDMNAETEAGDGRPSEAEGHGTLTRVVVLIARCVVWATIVLGTSFLAAFGAGFVAVFVVAKDEGPGPPVLWGTFATLVLLQVCASWLLRNRRVPWLLSGAVTVIALTVAGALVAVPLAFFGLGPLTRVAQSRATREWLLVAAWGMPILGALAGAGLGIWLTRRRAKKSGGCERPPASVGPAPSPVSSHK